MGRSSLTRLGGVGIEGCKSGLAGFSFVSLHAACQNCISASAPQEMIFFSSTRSLLVSGDWYPPRADPNLRDGSHPMCAQGGAAGVKSKQGRTKDRAALTCFRGFREGVHDRMEVSKGEKRRKYRYMQALAFSVKFVPLGSATACPNAVKAGRSGLLEEA